jgi:hypothetical protein
MRKLVELEQKYYPLELVLDMKIYMTQEGARA